MPHKRKLKLSCEHKPELRRRALEALESADEQRRAKAVFVLCPCHRPGREIEERVLDLRSDRSRAMRRSLVHVYSDAGLPELFQERRMRREEHASLDDEERQKRTRQNERRQHLRAG